MNYQFISSQKAEFPVNILCRICKVPRSSYYDWVNSADQRQKKLAERDASKALVRKCYEKSRCNYGAPKITMALRAQGMHISKKKVARLMVELGIRGACARKKVRTTRADKNAIYSPDLVNRNFHADNVDQLLVSDLTYIPTKEGWLFLVCILDVCSRRIIGWSMARHMRVELFTDALRQMEITRNQSIFEGTIFHDDKGSQYSAQGFREALGLMGMTQSMGSVGDSYDNAAAKNLWSLLKRESNYRENFETIDEARAEIFDWINWYNSERIHSSIDYLSPIQFEEQLARATAKKVA